MLICRECGTTFEVHTRQLVRAHSVMQPENPERLIVFPPEETDEVHYCPFCMSGDLEPVKNALVLVREIGRQAKEEAR